MLAQSRQEHSGIQLEVNERILDSCTSLMMVRPLLYIQYRIFLKPKHWKNTKEILLFESFYGLVHYRQ